MPIIIMPIMLIIMLIIHIIVSMIRPTIMPIIFVDYYVFDGTKFLEFVHFKGFLFSL